MSHEHTFGGDWTQEKLKRLQKYLAAYMQIMHKRPYFKVAYIDAFAGTGYRTPKRSTHIGEALFPEFAEAEQQFLDGSARIALQTQPPFNTYIFVEKDPRYARELVTLREEYPQFDIRIVNAEANAYLQDLCENRRWEKHRAVLFLDPYGMQVEWRTIEAIAHTQAIDLWLLFPLGMAVNRLLRRDGEIDEAYSKRLDAIFGTHDWYNAFYHREKHPTLFGEEERIQKQATIQNIAEYFIERLQTIFAGVALNPLPLYNSRNNPLYLLCFAAGNPKGAPTAVDIAQDILGQ